MGWEMSLCLPYNLSGQREQTSKRKQCAAREEEQRDIGDDAREQAIGEDRERSPNEGAQERDAHDAPQHLHRDGALDQGYPKYVGEADEQTDNGEEAHS